MARKSQTADFIDSHIYIVGAQSSTPSQTARDPVQEAAKQDQNEIAILRAKTERKLFMESMNGGTLPCLPRENGFADTEPAKNLVTGTVYHGVNAILLKDLQVRQGYPTAEYVTVQSLDKVNQKLNLGFKDQVHVKKGEKGFFINFKDNKTNEIKSFALFNLAQVSDPQKIRDYAAVMEYERREAIKHKILDSGKEYVPYSAKKEGGIIKCSSTKPEEYIGQYLAAVSSGSQFKVSEAQAESFKKNTELFLFEKSENGSINPFKLNILSAQANKYCKEFLPTINRQQSEQATPHPHQAPAQEMEMRF